MNRGLLFWILVILWVLTIAGVMFIPRDWDHRWAYTPSLLQLVLFGLLGWDVYGPALRGK